MGYPLKTPSATAMAAAHLGRALARPFFMLRALARRFYAPRLGAAFCTLPMDYADLIGWASSGILLATLMRQVYTQWRERSTQGVSHWLFIGQLAASSGFLVYSYLVDNWVFVFTNAALLLTAVVGQMIYRRNAKEEAPG